MPGIDDEAMVARRRTPVLAAWEAMRYGMFIHFGMSTFTGHEFGRIPATCQDYAPTGLDVDQWIRVARDAGMKYAVLTAKHHYGHALWPTKASEFSVKNSPNSADVCGLFVSACAKYGVRPGFYYSAGWDRQHQPTMLPGEYLNLVLAQVEELLTGYGPLTELWFDIPWDFGQETPAALRRLYSCCKRHQPDCLVLLNQGFVDGQAVACVKTSYQGKDVSDFLTPLWPKDLNNGERTFPPESGHRPEVWFEGTAYYVPDEVCDSVGQMRWFWGAQDDVRPARQIYEIYRNSVGRGANLLLNVGPDREGRIPQAYVDRLMEVKAMIDHPSEVQDSILLGRPVTASSVFGGDLDAWGPQNAVDMDVTAEGGSRWAADEAVTSAWIEVDLGSEQTISRITASEYGDSIRSFEIRIAGDEGTWKTVHRGTTIGGPGIDLMLPKERASRVRLEILEATRGPTIWDLAAYPPRG